MKSYHITIYMFSVHFLIYILSFFQDVTCGIVVAVEAAGVFFFVQLAGQLGQLLAVLVPESRFHKINNWGSF